MAWIEITEDHLKTVLSGPELDGYRAAALANGQADPVASIIAQVTDMVRGYVAANASNRLGAVGIPQKLLSTTIDIIAYRVPNRVGRTPGESRMALHEQAVTLLGRVADGRFSVEEPVVDSTEVAGAPMASISTVTPMFSRENQDGL